MQGKTETCTNKETKGVCIPVWCVGHGSCLVANSDCLLLQGPRLYGKYVEQILSNQVLMNTDSIYAQGRRGQERVIGRRKKRICRDAGESPRKRVKKVHSGAVTFTMHGALNHYPGSRRWIALPNTRLDA